MNTAPWSEVEPLLDSLLKEKPEERDSAIERLDVAPQTKDEIRRLLRHLEAPEVDTEGPLAVPPSVDGYEVLRLAGRGGMADVYEAIQLDLKRRVALKVLRVEALSERRRVRFEAEIEALALVDHEHIASVHQTGVTDDGRPFVAIEFVNGETITGYCEKHKPDLVQRIELLRSACEAVQHAHWRGVIHRDLKPSNILVGTDGTSPRLRVIDFGIAKLLRSDEASTTRFTHDGEVVGTLSYMSPEQLSLDPDLVDARSDVYALGVVLHELVTGTHPFIDGSEASPDLRHHLYIRRRVRPVSQQVKRRNWSQSGVSRRDLGIVVRKALEYDADDRYESAAALSGELSRLLNDRPVNARRPSLAYLGRRFVRRRPVASAVAAVGLAALVVGGGLGVTGLARAAAQAERAQHEARVAQETLDLLTMLFEGSDPWSTPDSASLSARDLLDRAADRLSNELVDEPRLRAELFEAIGTIQRKLALLPEAEASLLAALEERERAGDKQSVEFASTLGELGMLNSEWVRLDIAEDYYKRALQIQTELTQVDHPLNAALHVGLGVVHYKKRLYESAEDHYLTGLDIYQRLYGDKHEETTLAMNNLGVLLNVTGRYDEAETLHRRALASRQALYGDQHPYVAMSMGNLARVLENKSDFAGAELLERQVTTITRAALGNDHPNLARALNNLAVSLRQKGRAQEAVPMLREAVDITVGAYGTSHSTVALYQANLSDALTDIGEWNEANELLHESLATTREVQGEEHPGVASLLQKIAIIHLARSEPMSAESYVREAISALRRSGGPNSNRLLPALLNLGRILTEQGKYLEAGEALGEAREVAESAFTSDHWLMGALLNTEAGLLEARSEFAGAEAKAGEAIQVLRIRFDDEHWRLASTRGILASCLAERGSFSEAEAILLRSHELVHSQRGEFALATRTMVRRLVTLYRQWDKPDRAAEYEALLEDLP